MKLGSNLQYLRKLHGNMTQEKLADFLGVTYGFGFETKKDVEDGYSVGSADTPLELLKFF